MQLFALLIDDGSARSSKSLLGVINVVPAFSDVVHIRPVLVDLASKNTVKSSSGLEQASFGYFAASFDG